MTDSPNEPITLSPGAAAPTWSAEALSSGGAERLSSEGLAGQAYVLYFYPKDDTPGCTTQACDFRDNINRVTELGYRVIGVSPDTLAKHEKFRDKYELPHSLVSDGDRALCEAFGVWREKKNYGKVYMGLVRSTFVVSAEGVITDAQYNVRAKGHVERLLKSLSS